MVDINSNKIPIYPGINDSSIAPTLEQGGNISHFYAQFNSALEKLESAINTLESQVTTLENTTSEENPVTAQEIDLIKARLRYFEMDYNGYVPYIMPFRISIEDADVSQTITVEQSGIASLLIAKGIENDGLLGIRKNTILEPIVIGTTGANYKLFYFTGEVSLTAGDSIEVFYNATITQDISVDIYLTELT